MTRVQVIGKVGIGTKVQVGAEPGVGAGFDVLAVIPPHKKVGGFGITGQLDKTRFTYGPTDIKITVVAVSLFVGRHIPCTPASTRIHIKQHFGINVLVDGYIIPSILNEESKGL